MAKTFAIAALLFSATTLADVARIARAAPETNGTGPAVNEFVAGVFTNAQGIVQVLTNAVPGVAAPTGGASPAAPSTTDGPSMIPSVGASPTPTDDGSTTVVIQTSVSTSVVVVPGPTTTSMVPAPAQGSTSPQDSPTQIAPVGGATSSSAAPTTSAAPTSSAAPSSSAAPTSSAAPSSSAASSKASSSLSGAQAATGVQTLTSILPSAIAVTSTGAGTVVVATAASNGSASQATGAPAASPTIQQGGAAQQYGSMGMVAVGIFMAAAPFFAL